MQSNSKRALLFIFITILVDVIGLGVIIPVVPSLIEELTGEGLSAASKYGGWLIFSFCGHTIPLFSSDGRTLGSLWPKAGVVTFSAGIGD